MSGAASAGCRQHDQAEAEQCRCGRLRDHHVEGPLEVVGRAGARHADGKLELRFRILSDDGASEDITRIINPEMLPALWQNPRISAGSR